MPGHQQTLSLEGAVTFDTAARVYPVILDQLLSDQQCRCLDLSALEAFDSSLLSCLVLWTTRLSERGRQLLIAQVPPRVQQLIDVFCLHDLLVFDQEED